MKNDHRSKFSNLSNWKERSLKKIRASTGFELVTSAIPVRCSTNWAMKPHIGSEANLLSSYLPSHFTPHGRYELNKLASLPMCGFIAQLVEHRPGIAEVTGSNPVEALIFFRLLSFQLLKLENLLRWSFFTLIYHCSSHIWIISYILHAISQFFRQKSKRNGLGPCTVRPIQFFNFLEKWKKQIWLN